MFHLQWANYVLPVLASLMAVALRLATITTPASVCLASQVGDTIFNLFYSVQVYISALLSLRTVLTLSLPRVTLTDFTLSNARRFYSSMGNPTGVKGLNKPFEIF